MNMKTKHHPLRTILLSLLILLLLVLVVFVGFYFTRLQTIQSIEQITDYDGCNFEGGIAASARQHEGAELRLYGVYADGYGWQRAYGAQL